MSQSGLGEYASGLLARPGNWSVVRRVRDAAQRVTSGLGVSLDLFGARPGELDDDTGVLRYQFSTVFEFETDRANRGANDTPVGSVQFRTTIYTLSDPSDEVKEYIRSINHLRLHTIFDNGTYNGYMSGFGFVTRDQNEESGRVVGRDEIPATGLGVPNFSVEVYDDDNELAGYSTGYSMDFGVHESTTISGDDAPEGEVWTIGNENNGRYEIKPKANTPARERAKGAHQKNVYINGAPTGSVTNRGTTWLTKQHERPGAATYRSRKWITDTTSTPYQALSPGSKLYKVNETGDGLYFSTVKPRDFDTISAEAVDADATQTIDREAVLTLDEDDPTTFVVTEDEADPWALGKRGLTQTVETDTETDWTPNPMRGAR